MGLWILIFLAVSTLGALWTRQRGRASEFRVGGLYSVTGESGGYRVAKLLAHERGLFHVRVYKQKFAARPVALDSIDLTLGTPLDSDGAGIRHLALREKSFRALKPVFV